MEFKQKSVNKYGGDVAELATCFINRLHWLIAEEHSRGKTNKQVAVNSYILIFQAPYQP